MNGMNSMNSMNSTNSAAVYWITGFSGAGKTTIGTLLYQHIKAQGTALVLLDGDTLREVFGNDLGYTSEDRLKSAMRNARLCKLLSDQGIAVVCCTISMFHEVREWNRDNISSYKEIYIKVPSEILQARNQKGLYSNGLDVVGVDVMAQEPNSPDITVTNDGARSPQKILDIILKELEI